MRPRPTPAELDAERVRLARRRAAQVAAASLPAHVEDARPVALPVQHHRGPRPGARPAADMLRPTRWPSTAPLPAQRPRGLPSWRLGGLCALLVALGVVYYVPFAAAAGWWPW